MYIAVSIKYIHEGRDDRIYHLTIDNLTDYNPWYVYSKSVNIINDVNKQTIFYAVSDLVEKLLGKRILSFSHISCIRDNDSMTENTIIETPITSYQVMRLCKTSNYGRSLWVCNYIARLE